MKEEERYMIVVNFSGSSAQSQVKIPWSDVAGETWQLTDLLSGACYERDGNQPLSPGLYVELGPWNCHFFQCLRTNKK